MSTQLRVFEDDEIFFKAPFDLREWRARGKAFKPEEDESRAQADARQWAMGDWLLEGEVRGRLKERAMRKHFREVTGYTNWGSLKNLRMYARRFPPARRRDGQDGRPRLEFSCHVAVAAFDEATQEMLLTKATTIGLKPGESGWKHAELKKYIKTEQKSGRLPLTGKAAKHYGKDDVKLEMKLSKKEFDKFSEMTYQMYGHYYPASLVRWMMVQFWKEHGEQVKAHFAAGTLASIIDGLPKTRLP